MLLLLEAGIAVDLQMMRQLGTKALLLALTGIFSRQSISLCLCLFPFPFSLLLLLLLLNLIPFPAPLGIIMPVLMGFGFTVSLGYSTISSLSIGCALAPTSTGIAIEIFKSMKALSSPVGQLVTTSAVIDDVISLIILAELQTITATPSAWEIARPITSSLFFVVVLGGLSIYLPALLERYPGGPLQSVPIRLHKVCFLLCVCVSVSCCLITFP